MRVVLRCDASSSIGAGHVVRNLALADCLADRGWQCSFATTEQHVEIFTGLADCQHHVMPLAAAALSAPEALAAKLNSKVDLLVLDHYGLGLEYETGCRNWARQIAVIDDHPDRPHDCDILIDQTPGRKATDYRNLVPPHCLLLLGAGFALLRREFLRYRLASFKRRGRDKVRRVLLAFGGVDTKQMTQTALRALSRLGSDYDLDVVVGTETSAKMAQQNLDQLALRGTVHHGVSNMAKLMFQADIAIGAAGMTSLERCTLGLPTIAIITAENQRCSAMALAKNGALTLLGDAEDIQEQDIIQEIQNLADNSAQYQSMARAATIQCDGLGTSRSVAALEQTRLPDGSSVYLRPATMADADTMLNWQSDSRTQRFFHNLTVPSSEAHQKWLSEKLGDPECYINIIIHDDVPAGVLHLDPTDDGGKFTVSMLVAPDYCQLNIGLMALKFIRLTWPRAVFHAEVTADNYASHALFVKAGYSWMNGAYINFSSLPNQETQGAG